MWTFPETQSMFTCYLPNKSTLSLKFPQKYTYSNGLVYWQSCTLTSTPSECTCSHIYLTDNMLTHESLMYDQFHTHEQVHLFTKPACS